MIPPTFVISLKRSSDRRRLMTEQLTAVGLSAEFVDAVDGRTFTRESILADVGPAALEVRPGLHRPLTYGEIGCALSHRECYRRILDGGIAVGCILEDDIDLPATFPSLLTEIALHAGEWDLALLAHHSSRRSVFEGAEAQWRGRQLGPQHRLARPAEFAMGAMAYLVTNEGARRLLAYSTPVRMPADWITGYAPRAGVRSVVVSPPVVVPHLATHLPTTLPLRDAPDVDGRRTPPRTMREQAITWGGHAWLLLRKAGLFTDSYARRY